MNFVKRKVFFEKIMGPYQGLCQQISKTLTFFKIMGCEKSMKLHQKKKSMKYGQIDKIVYSHFLQKTKP